METISRGLVGLMQLLFGGGVIILLIYLFIIWPSKINKRYQAFAASHGLDFRPGHVQDVDYTGILPGKASRLVWGTDNKTKQTVSLFQYIHIVGSGKNRREYRRTVASVKIKPTKTHAFINSKLNDLTEQIDLASSQRYEAEGAFGKYFDIYSPDGQTLEVLSIFAPDVLSLLMANYGYYDIEVKDDRLYIYDYNLIDKQDALEEYYQRALALAKELNTNAPRALQLKTANGTADPSGVTALKRGSIKLVTVVIVAVIMVGTLASSKSSQAFVGLVQVGVVGWIIFTIVRNVRLKMHYKQDRQDFVTTKMPS